MSNLCVFNFKENDLNYAMLDKLANELVRIALENKIAVTFNDNYWNNIISNNKMETYFTVSNSFLYRDANCIGISSLFDLQPLVLDLCKNDKFGEILKDKIFYNTFIDKYHFLQKLIDCIFEFDINLVEIYISENGCEIKDKEDFKIIHSTKDLLLNDLFDSVYDELNNHFNYKFENVILLVSKD